ncbi:hypothetical protein GALMADRAFT_324437 [Galerina marginata CBS 339.88]|uniref:Uncharacterized protein n=1 Tax=Galerina marginata (strain CBS 339.88) TaxID=685588 RepID=A0A067TYQ7_GALM3|nr:hypothetical protein GALMADRAFT_324437 [Galerina marginata CBS 339.88]
MDYSSETESHSSCSSSSHSFHNPPVDDALLIRDPRHLQRSSEQPLTLQDIRREIQTILRQDISHLTKTENIADDILLSSAILLNFLTCIPRLLANDKDIPVIIAAFSALVTPQFIERLFEYRRISRSAPLRIKAPKDSTVQTWVDVFLARLSLLVGPIAFGTIRIDYPGPICQETIKLQKQDDAVHATSQLPENWHDLKFVIGSHNFSPAAKRIALSLLFAVYVMGPQLTFFGSWQRPRYGDTAWPKPDASLAFKPQKEDLLDCLLIAARQMSSQMQAPSASFDCHGERTSMAMLISLFSVIYDVPDPNTRTLRTVQLRPEGLYYLLDLIWIVIGTENNSFLPLEELDLPQIILLRWGDSVPWSWSIWTDERNANTEHLRLVRLGCTILIGHYFQPCLPPNMRKYLGSTSDVVYLKIYQHHAS